MCRLILAFRYSLNAATVDFGKVRGIVYAKCKNNGDKLSMIGVPSDEAKELLEFVKEKKPETVIIRG